MPRRGVKASQARKWVFTIYPEGEEPVPWDEAVMNHLVYQRERCPSTGKEHYQGYVSFKQQRTMGQVKAALKSSSAHLEVCGHEGKAIIYATKEDTRIAGPWTFGEAVRQGKRTDCQRVAEMVLAGASKAEIAREYPATYMHQHKGIAALQQATRPPRMMTNRKVVVLIGPTGCGKTRWAKCTWQDSVYTVADSVAPWFDGYDNQRIALLDEFGPGHMPANRLKEYLDVYDARVPFKGGFVDWNPELIIVTSNSDVREWYPKATGMDTAAIERRIQVFYLPQEQDKLNSWAEKVSEELGLPMKKAQKRGREKDHESECGQDVDDERFYGVADEAFLPDESV